MTDIVSREHREAQIAHMQRVAELEAEIERLRGALERIFKVYADEYGDPWPERAATMNRIARRVLEGK